MVSLEGTCSSSNPGVSIVALDQFAAAAVHRAPYLGERSNDAARQAVLEIRFRRQIYQIGELGTPQARESAPRAGAFALTLSSPALPILFGAAFRSPDSSRPDSLDAPPRDHRHDRKNEHDHNNRSYG